MSELTIDISETTRRTLLQLAQTSGDDVVTIVDRAVENTIGDMFSWFNPSGHLLN